MYLVQYGLFQAPRYQNPILQSMARILKTSPHELTIIDSALLNRIDDKELREATRGLAQIIALLPPRDFVQAQDIFMQLLAEIKNSHSSKTTLNQSRFR